MMALNAGYITHCEMLLICDIKLESLGCMEDLSIFLGKSLC